MSHDLTPFRAKPSVRSQWQRELERVPDLGSRLRRSQEVALPAIRAANLAVACMADNPANLIEATPHMRLAAFHFVRSVVAFHHDHPLDLSEDFDALLVHTPLSSLVTRHRLCLLQSALLCERRPGETYHHDFHISMLGLATITTPFETLCIWMHKAGDIAATTVGPGARAQ